MMQSTWTLQERDRLGVYRWFPNAPRSTPPMRILPMPQGAPASNPFVREFQV